MSVNAHRSSSTSRFHRGRWPSVLLGVCLALIAAVASAAPTAGDGGVVFTYHARDASAVFLAGDFNGWDASATPLAKGAGGLWTVTVPLDPGEYEYKFVVDGEWKDDPDNSRRKPDPFGGYNSLVVVGDDGKPESAPAPATAPTAGATAAKPGKISVGRPKAADGGVLFTYREPGAGAVFLAGSFNGWNATDTPLQKDEQGNWFVVKKLDAGSYEYKFVVDGNWVADPENPDTAADPYGGVNSVVAVDAKGKVVAAAAAPASTTQGTTLATKMTVDGRYLSRFELTKNVSSDPRYRLLRPSMSVDLNFHTQVNDLVDSYTRLRMDSNQNVILNNVASSLDEASLWVHPDKFDVTAYWNREIFTSLDPLNLVGNIDHPATIGHDHLELGKGTAGAVIEADPFGVHYRGFFANVHNYDYYNNPNLYDNTGGDRIWSRFSHKFGDLEVGVPIWLQRELIWMDFETLVGQPSTGIPSFDEYLARSGDSSTWFETEFHDFKIGGDASLPLRDKTMRLGAEALYVDILESFVTGNLAGQNKVNGPIDVPFDDRSAFLASLRLDYNPDTDTSLRLQHRYQDTHGATPRQRTMRLSFLDQSTADSHISFTIDGPQPKDTWNWTELEWSHSSGDHDLKLYCWYSSLRENYGAVGRVVTGDSTRTDRTIGTLYLSGLVGRGESTSRLGHAELEFGLTFEDPDVADLDTKTYEFIGRWRRSVSRRVDAIADVRHITYDITGNGSDINDDFWAPFVGVEYKPQANLDVVFGFGVDPVDFSIDYDGRQFGRWWYRQRYLFDHPDATELDAERHLADARVFTLRAQMTF